MSASALAVRPTETPRLQRVSTRANVSTRSDAPSAEEINHAYDEFCGSMTIKALVIGQMLREKRDEICQAAHNRHTPEKDLWSTWLTENCKIPERTAQRWMEMAANSCEIALRGLVIDMEVISISHLLTAEAKDLPKQQQEARQLLFDFVGGKTMKECMAKVMIGDAEPHAMKRAHNGKTKGGKGSVDRKDFPVFIKGKLGHIQSHLANDLDADQRAVVSASFCEFTKAAPRWLLAVLAPALKEELKKTDAERSANKGELL